MQDNTRGEHEDTPCSSVKEISRELKVETLDEDEPTMVASDAKQIIADAIRLRVVTVSRDQSKYAAEDVLARLEKAGYELRKK